MATYTPNYQLHQWVPEDNFLRTDFNEDFSKIDTALANKANNSDVSNLQGQLNSNISNLQGQINSKPNSDAITNLQNQINIQQGQINTQQSQINTLSGNKAEFVQGSYTGNGSINPPQTINIGFQAKAIFIYGDSFSGMVDSNNCSKWLTITSTGFTAAYSTVSGPSPNISGTRYSYLAMR